MRRSELVYDHPTELVAQRPAARRDAARLLVAGRESLRDAGIADLPKLVRPGEVLVLNDTRVRWCRLLGHKSTGGRVEVLVLEPGEDGVWRALVRASRAPAPGTRIDLDGSDDALEVVGRDGATFSVRPTRDMERIVDEVGRPPLPPYVARPAEDEDRHRYQTLHARRPGDPLGSAGSSVAAPTAGLHLTPELLSAVESAGARVVRLALGVGAGTFRPVAEERVEDHLMHEEHVHVPAATAWEVTAALREGRRVTAVGTTALRALEAAATRGGIVRPVRGRTGLFLVPGTPFRTATRLLTNFHQPGTTLLALVHAFAGPTTVRRAYAHAIASGYRLFSFGDATLLERAT